MKPGTHFKMPYIQYPYIYEVRAKPRVINTTTGTKDLQMVSISLRVLSRPVAEKLCKFFFFLWTISYFFYCLHLFVKIISNQAVD